MSDLYRDSFQNVVQGMRTLKMNRKSVIKIINWLHRLVTIWRQSTRTAINWKKNKQPRPVNRDVRILLGNNVCLHISLFTIQKFHSIRYKILQYTPYSSDPLIKKCWEKILFYWRSNWSIWTVYKVKDDNFFNVINSFQTKSRIDWNTSALTITTSQVSTYMGDTLGMPSAVSLNAPVG